LSFEGVVSAPCSETEVQNDIRFRVTALKQLRYETDDSMVGDFYGFWMLDDSNAWGG
jgi:hypothetical protein